MSPAVGERLSSSGLWPLEYYPALIHTHTDSAKWRKQVLNKAHEDERKSWTGGGKEKNGKRENGRWI